MSVPSRVSELQRLIDLFRGQILALDDRVLTILQANWNPSRTRLISLIDLLVSDIESGSIVKASDITRLDRAQTLLTQLEAESTRIAAITNQIVPEAQTRAAQIAIERARALTVAQAPSAAKAAAIEVQWNSLNVSAVQEATAALADGTPLDEYLKANVEKQVTLVQETLIDGVARGVNAADLGKQIAAQTELPLKSAMSLARDTTMRAYDGATQRSFEANTDVLEGWEWSASLSSTTCSACIGMSGRRFPMSVNFLPRHSRCLTGDVRIQAKGVKAVSKRWYSGSLVELETMRGHRLTVTPNHPLLTPKGWIAAGLLHEGDDLISSTAPQWMGLVDDNDKDVPPSIEEIAGALSVASGVVAIEVPSAAPNFHGDGMDGEIEVVYTDGELGHRVQSALAQQFGEFNFVLGDSAQIPLTTKGSSLGEVNGFRNSALGVISGTSQRLPFLVGQRAHPEVHAVTPAAWRDACTQENAANRTSHYPEMLGSGLLRVSSDVVCDHCGCVYSGFSEYRSAVPDGSQTIPISIITIDAEVNEDLLQSYGAEPSDSLADVLHAFAGNVSSDGIVKFVIRAFEGHVYNLETENGYYSANGIITHNCRCSRIPVLIDPDNLLPHIETGPEWFARQDAAVQQQIIGSKVGYDGYAAGEVGIEDFVVLHEDDVWGDSYQSGSFIQAQKQAKARGHVGTPKKVKTLTPSDGSDLVTVR